jgi:cytochrome c oxidase cbb3-type subunit 3
VVDDEPPELPSGIDPTASRTIFLAMLALVATGVLAYNLAKVPLPPPPAAIAKDPLLVRGRTVYFARCASCHGPEGRGDGAVAKDLPGPRVRNFRDPVWRHGDRAEQVLEVVARGVPNTAMSGWGTVLDAPDVRAVSAYAFYLAGRPVPETLRAP